MNRPQIVGEPVRWTGFPACRRPEGGFPQGSIWRWALLTKAYVIDI
ncbi:MAG: hypothetical protein KME46_28815 [Brasilonema angustatum HA4187-MV1]|nr:hypothetical protein [Brasilonema angustatum HA4187-MV1]